VIGALRDGDSARPDATAGSPSQATPILLLNENFFRRWWGVSCHSSGAACRKRPNNEYGVLHMRLAGVPAR
jgi:hypothetical protein